MKKAVVALLAVILGTGIATARPAGADPIAPGFDFFETLPGAHVDTPAGRIELMGRPIGPGTTDTIVQRHQGLDTFPGEIEIELVQLSLQSVAPVTVGGRLFDVFVDELPSARGKMTIDHTTTDGGTFTSILPVHALLTFKEVGGVESFTAEVMDTLLGGTSWSHTPPPLHPAPSGNFFPGVIVEQGGATLHPAGPPTDGRVPEPATLLLLGAGLTGFGLVAWRRRRSG